MAKLTACEYLDLVKSQRALKSDSDLCRRLGVQRPVISKIRSGYSALSVFLMLRLHECLGCAIDEMRELIFEEEFSSEARPPEVEELDDKWPARRASALKFIADYWRAEGESPSLKEIAERFGWASPNTAFTCTHRLAAEGVIRLIPGKERNIVLVTGAEAAPT